MRAGNKMQTIQYNQGARFIFTKEDDRTYEGGWLRFNRHSETAAGQFIVADDDPLNYRKGFHRLYFEVEMPQDPEATMGEIVAHFTYGAKYREGVEEIHANVDRATIEALTWEAHDDETPGDLWEAWGLLCEDILEQVQNSPTRTLTIKRIRHLLDDPSQEGGLSR